jgi:hypothetical protein
MDIRTDGQTNGQKDREKEWLDAWTDGHVPLSRCHCLGGTLSPLMAREEAQPPPRLVRASRQCLHAMRVPS